MNQINLKDPKTLITTFVVVFVLIAIPLTVISVVTTRDDRSKAAGTVSLYLSPASQSYTVGSDIVVQVRENSGAVPVTAVDVKLSYDVTTMDFVSIDTASGLSTEFGSNATTPTGGSGLVSVVRFVPQIDCPTPIPVGGCPPAQSVSGDKLIATVRFKAKAVPATTNLAFTNAVVYLASDGTNGVGTATGATYTITDPPPAVNITSPANNALVNGSSLTVTADATDNLGVTKVDFYKDTDQTPLFTDTTPNAGTNTYSFVLNTTALTNAVHTLRAIATDTNGGVATSQISVTVDNSAPTGVAVTAPISGSRISKTVIVSASATDNRAITKVEFYVDGALTPKFTSTIAPYTFNWDTTLETSAQHTLFVKAYDGINITTSTPIPVIVDNTPPTKPTLSATAVSQTQINLSWTASTDSQGTVTYDLYRNSIKINPTPLTVLTYSDTGLTASTTYNYFVRVSDTTPIPNTTDSNVLAIATLSPFKVGDINRDGSVNSADLAILLSTWGSTTDLRADITLDGVVNSADLAVLLSRWGS